MSQMTNEPKSQSPISNLQSGVTAPRGFRAAGVACGIKKAQAQSIAPLDLALVVSDYDCVCAGMFTTNRVQAAPVLYDKETLAKNRRAIRAVIINSGCANACTGDAGLDDARTMAAETARALGIHADQVLVMSTGVIGQRLPMDKIRAGIALAAPRVSPDGGEDAARAIMTTDTRPKYCVLRNTYYAIGGMCKGAGMIHPQMATMLTLITTDARIAPDLLDRALRVAVNQSFNRISVDGDTSTNDTVLVLANGASGKEIGELEIGDFTEALTRVCVNLAQQIVRDGEGATKFVEIVVSGARAEEDAVRVAKTIAHSPLVKTALYGGDANWGRILMAAGNSGVAFDPEAVDLWISGGASPQAMLPPLHLVAAGAPLPFAESESSRRFAEPELLIDLRLGAGSGQATVWTCDLSHEYVTINGRYRT
jgi:glutamate N-acetyltransferase/amino-acid N-acetyltransferase